MDDLYRDYILDHYRNPHNFGDLPEADLVEEESNPLCGDQVKIFIRWENDRVADVRFRGRGCAISQASASLLTDLIKGKTRDELVKMGSSELLEALGIPIGPTRRKCALLSLNTLRKGLQLPPVD